MIFISHAPDLLHCTFKEGASVGLAEGTLSHLKQVVGDGVSVHFVHLRFLQATSQVAQVLHVVVVKGGGGAAVSHIACIITEL